MPGLSYVNNVNYASRVSGMSNMDLNVVEECFVEHHVTYVVWVDVEIAVQVPGLVSQDDSLHGVVG